MPGSDLGHTWYVSESVRFALARRHIFAWSGPYNGKLSSVDKMLFLFRYESQRENLSNQSFNIEQQNFSIQQIKDTKTTVRNLYVYFYQMKRTS